MSLVPWQLANLATGAGSEWNMDFYKKWEEGGASELCSLGPLVLEKGGGATVEVGPGP